MFGGRMLYTADQRYFLNRWFILHINNPYPKTIDVKTLTRQTGLTAVQILTWFANTRSRRSYRIIRYKLKFARDKLDYLYAASLVLNGSAYSHISQ